MQYVVKQPSEVFAVSVDYTSKLPTGASLVSATCSAINKSTGLTDNTILSSLVGVVDATAKTVTFVVTGGTDNIDYKVTVLATLNLYGPLEDDVTIACRNF